MNDRQENMKGKIHQITNEIELMYSVDEGIGDIIRKSKSLVGKAMSLFTRNRPDTKEREYHENYTKGQKESLRILNTIIDTLEEFRDSIETALPKLDKIFDGEWLEKRFAKISNYSDAWVYNRYLQWFQDAWQQSDDIRQRVLTNTKDRHKVVNSIIKDVDKIRKELEKYIKDLEEDYANKYEK